MWSDVLAGGEIGLHEKKKNIFLFCSLVLESILIKNRFTYNVLEVKRYDNRYNDAVNFFLYVLKIG